MIKYALECSQGHGFDDWFDSMAAFDRQQAENALVCPQCGDRTVRKALMAPNVAASSATPPAMGCGAAASCAQGGCPMARGT